MLYLIVGGVGYSLFLLIFVACPLIGKLILLAINLLIPDPLPYIDEIVMIASTAGNIFGAARKTISVVDFATKHKVTAILIAIVVIIAIKYIFF